MTNVLGGVYNQSQVKAATRQQVAKLLAARLSNRVATAQKRFKPLMARSIWLRSLVQFGVVGNGKGAIALAGNHGRGPGPLDVGAHVPRIIGPVGQHGLVGAQVAPQQARRLRAVAGVAAGQGQGANAALCVAAQVALRGEVAPAAAERLANGAVFFSHLPPPGAPARRWNRPGVGANRWRFAPGPAPAAIRRLAASAESGRAPCARGRTVRWASRATTPRPGPASARHRRTSACHEPS